MRTAAATFTILPVGGGDALDPEALALLPLIGCGVGAIAGAGAWLAGRVLPEPLTVAVAFGASIVLTGAFHVDGFLDAADALFATTSSERRRAIMKDPNVGSFAAAAFTVVVVFWVAALWSLPASAYPFALAFAAGTARLASLANAYTTRHATGGAATLAFARRLPALPFVAGALVTLCAGSLALVPSPHGGTSIAMLIIASATVVAYAIATWSARRLGGIITGDVYGFMIVVLEPAVLLAIVVARA